MRGLKVDKHATRQIKSQTNSNKHKFNLMKVELESISSGGEVYTKYNGERLTDVEKERNVSCEVHSIELQYRIRMVWEVHHDIVIGDTYYEDYIIITDAGNHEYHGKPYTKQLSLT